MEPRASASIFDGIVLQLVSLNFIFLKTPPLFFQFSFYTKLAIKLLSISNTSNKITIILIIPITIAN